MNLQHQFVCKVKQPFGSNFLLGEHHLLRDQIYDTFVACSSEDVTDLLHPGVVRV